MKKLFHVCVCRADVSYHDMEEINKMQTVPDLERFLTSYIHAHTHAATHVDITVTQFPPVTEL